MDTQQKIAVLERELAALKEQAEKEQWQPKGGDYYVSGSSDICLSMSSRRDRLAGAEAETEEEAEQMAKAFLSYRWMWMCWAEIVGDWRPEVGDMVWVWCEISSGASDRGARSEIFTPSVAANNTKFSFPTKDSCELWYDRVGHLIPDLWGE
jgi:hypothetical protein